MHEHILQVVYDSVENCSLVLLEPIPCVHLVRNLLEFTLFEN